MTELMDVVYVTKDGGNPELKYSLRSLRLVLHDRVFIFGGAPSWVDTEKVVFKKRFQKGSPYASTRAHIAAACATPEVSDPFMLWNDDFYAMETIEEVPAMHRGPMSEIAGDAPSNRTAWMKGMRETESLLKDLGVAEPLSYDLHVPMVIHKSKMREALRLADKMRTDAVHLRSIYGNMHSIGGVRVEDPKMLRRVDPFPRGPWLSSSDDTFRSTVEPVLRYLFPDPSIYEKD